MTACGYVADKIRRLCSGKSKDGEKMKIKGVKERECVLSNGVAPKDSASGPACKRPPYGSQQYQLEPDK